MQAAILSPTFFTMEQTLLATDKKGTMRSAVNNHRLDKFLQEVYDDLFRIKDAASFFHHLEPEPTLLFLLL
jgi:hypothetical protein